MHEAELLSLAGIVGGGVALQVLAVRAKVPAILLLLSVGLLVGPVFDLVDPDELLGDLLFPIVALAVGVILFEGAIELDARRLRDSARPVALLVTVGAVVTGLVLGLVAVGVLGIDADVAAIAAAILVVSGPTVVGPLLDQIRAEQQVDDTLRAEGVLVDPVGAIAAVIVAEVVLARGGDSALAEIAIILGLTLLDGIVLGVVSGIGMVAVMRRRLVPDGMRAPVVIAVVLLVLAVANSLQDESGLLAVTIAGLVIGSRRGLDVRSIAEVTASARVLLLGGLFIVLAARVDGDALSQVAPDAVALTLVLVLVARPLAVAVSALLGGLDVRRAALVAVVAPRGVVAAAVASLFGLRLEESGAAGAETLAPLVFGVIVGSIIWTAAVATPVARALGLAESTPRTLVLVHGGPFAEQLARRVTERGGNAVVIEPDRRRAAVLRQHGIQVVDGQALADGTRREVPWWRVASVLLLGGEDEVDALIAAEYRRHVDGSAIAMLPSLVDAHPRHSRRPDDLEVPLLFDGRLDAGSIRARLRAGAQVKATPLTEEFGLDQLREVHGADTVPLIIMDAQGVPRIVLSADPVTRAGDVVLHLPHAATEPPSRPDRQVRS